MREILTNDYQMQKILQVAENVASSSATIMIKGESGTGKELLAHYIHQHSQRSQYRLVAINCAAMPDGLLESELFGYEKGAFTGAHQAKPGKFELAHRSTFLLDEMSELPLVLQAKLLRVLQEGEVERLGGKQPVKINSRIIATTNKDLRQLVNQGLFREDLFYRLNVIPIEIPSLRERPKDLRLLSEIFVKKSSQKNNKVEKRLSQEAERKLMSWSWPGNIRELENVIERAVLLSQNEMISEADIHIEGYLEQRESLHFHAGMKIQDAEKELILKTLDYTNQNRTQAAHMLGISIRTLRNKINEYREMGEI